jgi:hypothetical protein
MELVNEQEEGRFRLPKSVSIHVKEWVMENCKKFGLLWHEVVLEMENFV